MNAVFYRLTAIHRRLQDEIKRELGHRAPNSLKLLRLKKLKLAVKDRLYGHLPRMRRA
jgi:uncharacterized protein YdcH (DUF465 family)